MCYLSSRCGTNESFCGASRDTRLLRPQHQRGRAEGEAALMDVSLLEMLKPAGGSRGFYLQCGGQVTIHTRQGYGISDFHGCEKFILWFWVMTPCSLSGYQHFAVICSTPSKTCTTKLHGVITKKSTLERGWTWLQR
jgi:hypothetical protein